MKKFLCVFLTAVMLMAMLPVAFTASADTREEICGAELWVDVPVNGLELNGKDDVEISAAYTSATTQLAYPDPMDNVFKVNSVIWYDTQNPGTALKSGTKAQLGKTYRVSVILDVRDGFVMHPDAKQHPGTKVKGQIVMLIPGDNLIFDGNFAIIGYGYGFIHRLTRRYLHNKSCF